MYDWRIFENAVGGGEDRASTKTAQALFAVTVARNGVVDNILVG